MPDSLRELLVGPECDGMRLDAFLAKGEGMPSRSACARLVEDGLVTINSTSATSKSERVQLGDRIQATVPVADDAPQTLRPNYDIPLDVRFEDDYLLVISKQAGLVCHPSPGHTDDTLANALVAHCGADHLGMLQGEDRPGIVHRLDMDTSGLMLAAKDDASQQALQDLIRLRTLDRRYVTLVHGYLAADEGTITTGIARSKRAHLGPLPHESKRPQLGHRERRAAAQHEHVRNRACRMVGRHLEERVGRVQQAFRKRAVAGNLLGFGERGV